MKRIFFILVVLSVCAFASAQGKKVETFNKNTWHWIESTDKYQSIKIEDGFMVISNIQNIKNGSDYQNLAKTFARIPLRPAENFKMTIKYLVPNYNECEYHILFNTDKKCMTDDEETGQFESYSLSMNGPAYKLDLDDAGVFEDKLPGKVKQKGEYPMELVIWKQSKSTSIELNGIQLFQNELIIKNPCVGFIVPLFDKKKSYLKIDEIIVEQADSDND